MSTFFTKPNNMFFSCTDLAVPNNIMQHIVKVESSGNPYAIGVVGGRLQRQPRNLTEAVSTAKMLEQKGYNFSLGLTQVNRYNLKKYGLYTYEQAFQVCPNLKAGSLILKECYDRSKDWGKSFSCYYSGNFTTGYKHGYVQKIFSSMGNRISTVTIRPNTSSPSQKPNLTFETSSTIAYNSSNKTAYIPNNTSNSNNTNFGKEQTKSQNTQETIKTPTNMDSAFVF